VPKDAEIAELDYDALQRRYEDERAKRLRSDGNGQYQPLREAFAADPRASSDITREPVVEEIDVAIVGAGFSGLLTAGRLRQAGVEKIRIIDKAGDFGGTWYWNRYPGCACDIESYIYLPLLEETGYVPVEKYSKAPEIYAYCQKLGEHYGLCDAALFQTTVTGLTWDEARARWIVSTDRDDRIATRFAIICGGFLSQPKMPRIPGIESFKGHSFHTSRWDYAYTGGDSAGKLTGLAGKRVGIIGTGATAIQCVPHLAEAAEHLYVFQRTPSSCDARDNAPTDLEWARSLKPGWQKQRMENFNNIVSGVPEPEDLVRDGWTAILNNVGFLDANGQMPDLETMRRNEIAKMEKSRRRVDAIVKDRKTAEALKPYYNYLCKRPGFSDYYLQTFNRPNVTLVDTEGRGVERVTPKGVVAGGEEYELDCLIYATGFEFLTEYAGQVGFEIEGKGGRSLSDRWSQGTRTLHGIQTRGFPNLYILGFAQNGVTANFTHMADERAEHLAYLIPRLLKDDARTVEPSQAAEDAWVQGIIDGRGPRRAFLQACPPSYYNHEGRETPATALNDIYGPGSAAFFKLLADWRAADALHGLEVTY
jgi:cyclohexanone monooxygenase